MSNAALQECPMKLGLDQACLEVYSYVPHKVDLWQQYEECFQCDNLHWATVPANENVSLLINTSYPINFYYTNEQGLQFCHENDIFEEHGVYGWNITEGSCSNIWKIKQPALHFYLPFVVAFLVYIIGTVLVCVGRCVYRQEWSARVWLLNVTFSELENFPHRAKGRELQPLSTDNGTDRGKRKSARLRKPNKSFLQQSTKDRGPRVCNDLGSPQTREASPAGSGIGSTRRQISTRVKSLDAFRGICIAMMIFVNYGGGQYRFFRHTPWNGMTMADLIFPWFLWVMGMSLVVSLRSKLRSDRSRCSVWLTALQRSLLLIVLGLLLNSFGHLHNDLTHFRYGGVLQRIGVSYLIVASVETIFMKLQGPAEYGLLLDLWYGWAQWVCALALAGLWMLLTFFVNVPYCGAGYLGPGGMHENGKFVNCTGGAAGYLDRIILHPNHMYKHPTSSRVFHSTQPYDPEGLLGTLTAAFLVCLGAHASRVMLCYDYTGSRVSRWIFWGVLCGLVGGMLCGFRQETGHIPINKNLFSLSFVLVTGGLAYLVLAALYTIIDYKNWWSGAPFSFCGMNSILLYVGHEITRQMFPWSWKPFWGTHAEYLFMNLWGTSLWIFIAYLLYRKRVFLRL